MGALAIIAEAFLYPGPGRAAALRAAAADLAPGAAHDAFKAFVDGVEPLTLEAWEELYTQTLDLDPYVAPYVGYQTWGERYQRGELLAQLNRAYAVAHIDTSGELSDHLVPVLRFLDRHRSAAIEPVEPPLMEIVPAALESMRRTLSKRDSVNAYLHLLEAALATVSTPLETGTTPPPRRPPDPIATTEGRRA